MTEEILILFYGTNWCSDCKRERRIFSELEIQYNFIDLDQNKQAKDRVIEINKGNSSVPTIIFPDGSILVEPNDNELRMKLRNLKQ